MSAPESCAGRIRVPLRGLIAVGVPALVAEGAAPLLKESTLLDRGRHGGRAAEGKAVGEASHSQPERAMRSSDGTWTYPVQSVTVPRRPIAPCSTIVGWSAAGKRCNASKSGSPACSRHAGQIEQQQPMLRHFL